VQHASPPHAKASPPPSSSSSSCAADDIDYVETLDYAIEGNTIRGIYYTCLSECETACDADDTCVAFVDHFDATPVTCKLKSALSGLHVASHRGTLKNLWSKDVLPPMPPPIPPSTPPPPHSPYPPAIASSISNNPTGSGSSGSGGCGTNLTYNEALDYAIEGHTIQKIEYTCLTECETACNANATCVGYVDHYKDDPVKCNLKSSIEDLHVASHRLTLKNLYTKLTLPPMPPPIPPSTPPPLPPYTPPPVNASWANATQQSVASQATENLESCSDDLYDFSDYSLETEYAIEGYTIRKLFYTNLCECQEACDTDPDCIAFVDNYATEPKKCNLKSGYSTHHEAVGKNLHYNPNKVTKEEMKVEKKSTARKWSLF